MLPFPIKIYSKRRFIFFTIIFILLTIFAVFRTELVSALTNTFTQTDWSSGADTNATADENNLTGWTKYYSKDDSLDDSSGEIKLQLETSQP
jgi:hypothetical protein